MDLNNLIILPTSTLIFSKFQKEIQNFSLLLSSEIPEIYPRPIYNHSISPKYKNLHYYIEINTTSNEIVGLIEDLLISE